MRRTVPFESCREEYASLWHDCEIRPERRRTVESTARKILNNRPRYENVSRATGVPWFVIGIIHQMECELSFEKHLHNGDLLKVDGRYARTTRVPENRPKVWPPVNQDAWEASAIDALMMKKFNKIESWSIERIAYSLELYNGFGYRLFRKINSPYLWSFTNHYRSGKYVADRKWSATAVSGQSGALAILKVMMEIDPLAVDLSKPAHVPWPRAPGPEELGGATTTPIKEAAKSRSVWSLMVAFLVGVVNWFTSWLHVVTDWAAGWFQTMPDIASYVTDGLTPLSTLAASLKIDITNASIAAAGALILIAIVRHSRDKAELVNSREAQEQGDER